MNKQIVAAFDFDGTITKRDTLLPFLRKYGLSKLTKATCKASLRAGNRNFRNILKETTLNEIFYDYSSEKFEADGDAYASTLPQLYRSEILKHIESHKDRGHQLVLVTGSLGCYARPAASALGFDHVIAVEMISSYGRLTGAMEGANIRGPEKARRLKKLLKSESVELWAYGNSSGDKEMLEMADHAEMV